MKQILVPIEVSTAGGRPRLIRWNGRTYRVRELLDVWVYQTRWWSKEERRVYFRLWTNGGILEVWKCGAEWKLSRILD